MIRSISNKITCLRPVNPNERFAEKFKIENNKYFCDKTFVLINYITPLPSTIAYYINANGIAGGVNNGIIHWIIENKLGYWILPKESKGFVEYIEIIITSADDYHFEAEVWYLD